MMRPINILRATIGPGILEPVKCSKNMQLAINSSNRITIIEPKLPLLHQCIEPPGAEGLSSTLNTAALFDVRSTFQIESLESLGLHIFSRILIDDLQHMFNFGRISEPMIVGHEWSPVELSTRDCYLGVLLNTGEVMVLKRDSLDASDYSLKYRSFSCILDQMALPHQRLTSEGDIILTGDQFLELKVTDFSFGHLLDKSILLILAHESRVITIHKLEKTLPLVGRISTEDLAVKLTWSAERSELYFVLRDNSVWGCKFDFDSKFEVLPVRLKPASRFFVSHIYYCDTYRGLLITDTNELHVVSFDSPSVSCLLPYNSMIVNLSVIESDPYTVVLLPTECGRLSVAKIHTSSRNIEIIKDTSMWDTFHSQTLHVYQTQLQKEQNKALSKAFQPYLADAIEGQMFVHGFLPLLASGMAAVVYSLGPRNVITHTIKSKKDFNVSLVPIQSIASFSKLEAKSKTSTLPYLNALVLSEKDRIPKMNKEMKEGKEKAVSNFIAQLKHWKKSIFSDPVYFSLSVSSNPSLQESLIQNFRDNEQINLMQKLYLLNVSLTKTLQALQTNIPSPCDALIQELTATAVEQDTIASKIRTHLASIVIQWASEQSIIDFDSTLDTFLLSTYRLVLLHSNMVLAELSIPEHVKLTISTDLCTEMFEISRKEVISSLKTVVSSSKHNWPRCDMTLLPILDLSNKMDELENHNYLSMKKDESHLLDTIFGCLNFCVFTGTRTFDLKVGV